MHELNQCNLKVLPITVSASGKSRFLSLAAMVPIHLNTKRNDWLEWDNQENIHTDLWLPYIITHQGFIKQIFLDNTYCTSRKCGIWNVLWGNVECFLSFIIIFFKYILFFKEHVLSGSLRNSEYKFKVKKPRTDLVTPSKMWRSNGTNGKVSDAVNKHVCSKILTENSDLEQHICFVILLVLVL